MYGLRHIIGCGRGLGLILAAIAASSGGAWAQPRSGGVPPASSSPSSAAVPDEGAPTSLKTAKDAEQRLTVPVMINGKGPFQFLIDTASNHSVISRELATALELPAGAPASVQNAGGVDVEPTAMIGQLDAGPRRLKNVAAPMLAEADIGAAGMIGLDVLHDERIVMDFKSHRISLEPSRRAESEPRAIVVYGQRRFGQLVLVDAAWDGRPIFVVLDSGAWDTVANAAFRRLAATHAPSPGALTQTHLLSVTGRIIPADLSVLPQIRVGGVLVHNLSLAYANLHTFEEFDLTDAPALLLGMDVMHLFDRVSVDFRRREVNFVMPEGTAAMGIVTQ